MMMTLGIYRNLVDIIFSVKYGLHLMLLCTHRPHGEGLIEYGLLDIIEILMCSLEVTD